ncbi:MAG: OmpA family protein, partial [Rubrivivax sp.]|nr:OmpA family protein [Rubrivivax sp.]
MKKLNRVAALFASVALATPIGAFAQAKSADNWVSANGIPWKNGSNELCWRDAGWTPATANDACDGVIKAAPPPPPAPPPPVA